MLLNIDGINIYYSTYNEFILARRSILFIHGFANDSSDWNDSLTYFSTDFNLITIDLPGFGKSSVPIETKFYNESFLLKIIDTLINVLEINKLILIGYSMGGRLALSFTHKSQDKIEALILESTSPGIDSTEEREIRRNSDLELADFINKSSIEEFITYWKNQPLFHSQNQLPKMKKDELAERMKSLNKLGLINSLKAFGTGVMESKWNFICELTVPTLLITGSLDNKFTSINMEMNKLIKNSVHHTIAEVGHNVHIEKPKEFVNLVISFLKTHLN